MDVRPLAACAEFPNDNPALHRGAIWFCAGLAAAPCFERPVDERVEVPAEEPAEVLTTTVTTTTHVDPPATPATRATTATTEPATDPTPPVVDADDETDDIEIVEDSAFDDAIDESPEPPAPEPPVADDPFLTLARVLDDVAMGAGADDAALATLRTLIGQLRIEASAPADHARIRAEALAWQGILRGESEDFSACGAAMLDEWSAAVVATALGQPGRAETIKRELRRRGVAAFGLVDQAA